MFFGINTLNASVNSYGQLGYINTPSAFTFSESSIYLGINRGEPDRKFNFTFSPFNFLDLSIFYADITGKDYPGNFQQSYKDKGFNAKLNILKLDDSSLSIGFNDFAGTGIYSSEYLVFSKQSEDFDFSFGLGWGLYNDGITVNNPLRGRTRQVERDLGGTLNPEVYFSGEEASIFGAIKYNYNQSLSILMELDPTRESSNIGYDFQSNINYGVEYVNDDYFIKLSHIRGSEITFQIGLFQNFMKFNSYPLRHKSEKVNSYESLKRILDLNKIGLKRIAKSNDDILIAVRQNAFLDQTEVIKRVLEDTKQIRNNKNLIISQETLGMEVVRTFHKPELSNIKKEQYTNSDLKDNAYVVNDKFPYFNNNLYPNIRTYIAAREGLAFTGLFLENNFEAIFSENLFLLSNFKYSIYDEFDQLTIPPRDTYPNQVRSDNKDYFNNFSEGVIIGRLELNRLFSRDRKHFYLLSAGIFEEMFGGIGGEYLYYPEGSLYSIGIEAYYVRKREYDMKLQFQDYENILVRTNFSITEPKTGINIKLSAGEYLAGDIGYTFEVGRKFHNGIKMSAFFTRTDVPKRLYGEGSFDKGVKFTIPFSFFGNKNSLSNYEWHPLTKDPGALLIKGINLNQNIERFRVY